MGREDKEIFRQLQQALPEVRNWIDCYVEAYAHLAVPIVDLGFRRLSQYFDQSRLKNSKAVKVDRVQVPPLSQMGLPYFTDFEETSFIGITYMDTFFLAPPAHDCESTHFHELIHVIQWEVLGPDLFLMVYAVGLLAYGYENSPLERMAYELQRAFEAGRSILQLELQVREKTELMSKALS
ncbi:MAG: hypothetical protein FJ110_08890 [Deltaproteobacteria bacterium]|nr:hypothetical protein [Deltaproteobacteria bacterium]